MSKKFPFTFVRRAVAILLGLLPAVLGQLAVAQTKSAEPKYLPNRFLIVVETSKAMQRRSEAMVRAVQELLHSGVAAQAHRGDTIGVWTFNEDLFTGIIPLQQWTPETKEAIEKRVTGFLQAQKFEKRANLEKVVAGLDRINKNSQFVTVILVCLGDSNIQGTPFDARINQFFQTWRVQQQDAGAPFLIALRGQSGVFVDCSMNPSPWPPELPALPNELLTPLKPVLVEAPLRRPATSSVPPLIISGRKHDTASTNSAVQSMTPSPPTNAAPLTNLSAPSVGGIASSPAVVVQAPLATPTAPASGPPASNLVQPDKPAPLAAADSGPAPITAAVTNSNNSPEQSPAKSIPATKAPEPLAVDQKPEARPASSRLEPAVRNQEKSGDAVEPVIGSAQAAAPAARGHSGSLALAVTAVVSITALLGAVILWRARRQNSNDTSLITESFDRRKK